MLPQILAEFPTIWPFPRGDLYHWIPLLDRFDCILDSFNRAYKLSDGPQVMDIGLELLQNKAQDVPYSDASWTLGQLQEQGYQSNGDEKLLEVVLDFTKTLLKRCGNRSIYASSSRLNDLLNTTSVPILTATLQVGSELAQRYLASVKRVGSNHRHLNSALLANHYNINLDRVLSLALPFEKTPISSRPGASTSDTPASGSKPRQKTTRPARDQTSGYATDLVALATASDDSKWSGWGDVKVMYYPQTMQASAVTLNFGEKTQPNSPATPTPLRRSTSANAGQSGSPRTPSADDASASPRQGSSAPKDGTAGLSYFVAQGSEISSTSLYDLIKRIPSDAPADIKYQIFHRLRVAKALTESVKSRQQILATRLLAITNLVYIIHSEDDFVRKCLGQDMTEPKPYQLVYQLANLIHPRGDDSVRTPLWLQTLAISLLEPLSALNIRNQEVMNALHANASHGVLLYVVRKALADMKQDSDEDRTRVTEVDVWRNCLVSLTMSIAMSSRPGTGNELVTAGLLPVVLEMLSVRSGREGRNFSVTLALLDGHMVSFLDNLIWTFQNGFNAFISENGLDAIAELVMAVVADCQSHSGNNPETKSNSMDYAIPYAHQQFLKALLKFIHHVMTNTFHFSANTDRLVRNLADKAELLRSFTAIIGDMEAFGSVVWTNAVTILSDFINNDPTSFAAISESGMIKTYLEKITGSTISDDVGSKAVNDNAAEAGDGPESPALVEKDTRPHPPTEEMLQAPRERTLAAGILPTGEAMTVIPQVLNALSLNNQGLKMVVKSRALERYLEVFESSRHVRCMANDNQLALNIGTFFDELCRHHPSLTATIQNAVLDMVARVVYLGKVKAATDGWGAKLEMVDRDGNDVSVNETLLSQLTSQKSSKGKAAVANDIFDVEMTDVPADPAPASTQTSSTSTQKGVDGFEPHITATASFLTSYMENNTAPALKSHFADSGGIELLIDLAQSPSISPNLYDMLWERGCGLSSVIAKFVEQSPVVRLHVLLKRTQKAVDGLMPLVHRTDPNVPYFAKFLVPNPTISLQDLEAPGAEEDLNQAAQAVKSLVSTQILFKALSECYSQNSRSSHFFNVNAYDYYLKLVQSLGSLLTTVVREDTMISEMIPPHWSPNPKSSPEQQTNGLEATGEDESSFAFESMGAFIEHGKPLARSKKPTLEETRSVRYKNYVTLRSLLHIFVPDVYPFLQTVGKALIPKGRDSRAERQESRIKHRVWHLKLAKTIASGLLDDFRVTVSNPEPTSLDFTYWMIMVMVFQETLLDGKCPRLCKFRDTDVSR